MLQIRHRLIRTYELDPVEDSAGAPHLYRLEVWKDLQTRQFWGRIYQLRHEHGARRWVLDESVDWPTLAERNELALLETLLSQLNEQMRAHK